MNRSPLRDALKRKSALSVENAKLRGEVSRLQSDVDKLMSVLSPFATSLDIARRAFEGPADQGHITAVAKQYIGIDALCDAHDAVRHMQGR